MNTIMSLNYVAVLVVAVIGFLLGWLWYSPVLFAKPWMAEMKITEEAAKAMGGAMARMFAQGFFFTLLGTFGLAVLLKDHGASNWLSGVKLGLFVGVFVVGVRALNASVWECKSAKLRAINVGHEVVLHAVQGAILGLWH
jgi:hypothetical protein